MLDMPSEHHPRVSIAQEMFEMFNLRLMRGGNGPMQELSGDSENELLTTKERELYYGCIDTLRNYVLGELTFEEPTPVPEVNAVRVMVLSQPELRKLAETEEMDEDEITDNDA